jgi:hypothetical protein
MSEAHRAAQSRAAAIKGKGEILIGSGVMDGAVLTGATWVGGREDREYL